MYPSVRQSKPWPGVGIDWTNPLAQGLQFVVPFNEKSGNPYEVVNRIAPSSAANMAWGSGVDGSCGVFNGSSSKLVFPAPAFPTFPGISVLVRCTLASLSATYFLIERSNVNAHWQLQTTSSQLQWKGGSAAVRVGWSFSGIATNEWHTFIVTDHAAALLYVDGLLVAIAASGLAPVDAAANINIGQYDNGTSQFLNGNVSVAMVANRVWTAREVSWLSANPWQVFQPPWPRGKIIQAPVSFSITENALPTHHASGSLTVHAVGINTTWTSGTTFSVSGIAGWSVASKTYVDGQHVTLILSCPASGGATGTLHISDGALTANATVNVPAISCSLGTISVNDTATITLMGSNTLWSQDNPVFTIAGGTGATIGSISISSNTSATAAVYAGTSYSATLTITDPSTGATTTLATASNTVTTTSYVTKGGQLVAFVFGNSSNAPSAVTAVNSQPTISVNGSPVSCRGPFWDMTTQNDPFIFYQLPSTATDTDVISFAAAAAWVTTAAGSATVYQSGSVPNYAGNFEQPLFGYTPFDFLPTNTTGLQVGFNTGSPNYELSNSLGSIPQNWFKRGSWTSGVTSSAADLRPATISGQAKCAIASIGQPNWVDALNWPDMTGTWTFVADDSDTVTPMIAALSVNSAAATVTSGPTTPDVPTTAGTLVDGVLVGQTWQWTIAYKGSPTSLSLGLTLIIEVPGGGSGSYTLSNEWLFAPNGQGGGAPALNRQNAAQTDPTLLSQLTVRNKGAASLRSFTGGYNGGQSNIVNPADLVALTDAMWYGVKKTTTASITTIRAYSLSDSPYIYFASNYTGTSVNGSGSDNLAYQYAPSSIAFSVWTSGLSSWAIMECVTAAPHGLYSGQLLTLSNNGLTAPASQTTVSVAGGGASGGSLNPGTYYVAYTYVQSSTGFESAPGTSRSAQFTVASGNIPRITFHDTPPSYATSRNIYLTAANGAAGTEVLYATGVSTGASTADLSAANAGSVPITTAYPVVSTTQGAGSPINYTFPAGLSLYPIFVTAEDKFVIWGYTGASTQGALDANTAAATYNVPSTSPFYATVKHPENSLGIPQECLAQLAANIPGCAGYVNVPIAATDATVEYMANIWLNYLPASRLCYLEVGNEPWNSGFYQGVFFNQTIATMAGNPIAAGSSTGGYALRAAQVANIFRTIWKQAGRGGLVRSVFNSQAVGPSGTQTIVNTLNSYNAANPSSPLELDVIAIAPYLPVQGLGLSDKQAQPTAQATVNPTGGGSSGGHLDAGTYYLKYTYIDKLTGLESNDGNPYTSFGSNSTSPSESAQFTVTSGNIPRVTFNDTLPSTVASRSIYLTLANGASGSEVLYKTGVTTATYDLSDANLGSVAPPTNNQAPDYNWAVASIAASKSTSIANTSVNPGNSYAANPWTFDSWADVLRHKAKYNTWFNGPSGYIAKHQGYLNSYVPVAGQPAPRLITYEGNFQVLVPSAVQNYPPRNNTATLIGQLSHDVFYHPSMYDVELAYLQFLHQNGIALANLETFTLTRLLNPGSNLIWMWVYSAWAGQQAGRGDNSDGKGTNLLWTDTGKAQDLANVSPRLQAWQDWAAAGNAAATGGLLAPFSHSPMIRSAATHGWRGLVMTRMNLLPASAPAHESVGFQGCRLSGRPSDRHSNGAWNPRPCSDIDSLE